MFKFALSAMPMSQGLPPPFAKTAEILGALMQNFQEDPQLILITGSLEPIL
ncbi:MAG: hypothetical protein HC934_09205 [Acaryochloridaceae cyanobacterium SU_2_1]|nr:hypothetical protein [Acaryochloridaceae cyanobacterium SU_2_1]